MMHKITYAINSNDSSLIQQFLNKLLLVGINSNCLKSTDKYSYFESFWDNSDTISYAKKHNTRNAGAKPKTLQYNNSPVTCGLVYQLREYKHLSDAQIAALLDISESTICRRRKKHLSNGCFFEESQTIF